VDGIKEVEDPGQEGEVATEEKVSIYNPQASSFGTKADKLANHTLPYRPHLQGSYAQILQEDGAKIESY